MFYREHADLRKKYQNCTEQLKKVEMEYDVLQRKYSTIHNSFDSKFYYENTNELSKQSNLTNIWNDHYTQNTPNNTTNVANYVNPIYSSVSDKVMYNENKLNNQSNNDPGKGAPFNIMKNFLKDTTNKFSLETPAANMARAKATPMNTTQLLSLSQITPKSNKFEEINNATSTQYQNLNNLKTFYPEDKKMNNTHRIIENRNQRLSSLIQSKKSRMSSPTHKLQSLSQK